MSVNATQLNPPIHKVYSNIKRKYLITQPIFQRLINVVSTLWINLKQRWSDVANETKSDAGFSTLHNIDATLVSNVETMLKQRWYNFISTLFQRVLNMSKSYIKISRASDKYGFVNLWTDNFILLNIFYNTLTIQLLINW